MGLFFWGDGGLGDWGMTGGNDGRTYVMGDGQAGQGSRCTV